MSSLTAHDRQPSGRRTRSRWFDPRLAIGLGLVVASVVGVMAIVTAADDTVTVYAADGTLAAGDVVTSGDLVERRVRLGELTGSYLAPGGVVDDGVVITRTVVKGELVPISAVGSADDVTSASIVVPVLGQLPRSVGEGSLVDLWAAGAGERGEYETPVLVASAATVVRIAEQEGIVSGGASVMVELMVPRGLTARILEAKADGDVLSIIASSGQASE
ncbi:hypothetical protein FB562_0540 [Homoserinimonas aerilata]|uniref:SAF domain-containing protein n=1 Tax=Homoserinimonas aerilata TaxID=1162970 RepID=A0A542YHB0_9MICO|nr:hypothetical protein [Homoserinimonas aerilata]TQL47479.1 hypothetical protein FB562_0540 [Homoserinimonas aerilata]